MRSHRQRFLAAAVNEHLIQLETAILEMAERGKPISPLEARLLLDSARARLEPVAEELGHEQRLTVRRRLRSRAGRVRARFYPRIGLLYHYPPKPIRLPATYFRIQPPSPGPTISIVTPSFEQDRFLERTIVSVLEQNYAELEYFVQDGKSADRSCEILRRYDDRLTGWCSEPDAGQADAINRAFAHTSGELMGWINSDDLMLPGALAYVATFFQTHPEVDVVYGDRLLIDEDDGQIGAWILPAHHDRALTFADYVPQETLFWRRSIWDASGAALDATFSYALDWDLLLRFRATGARIVHLPRYLGAFRVHDEQKTSAASAVGQAEMARLRERIHGEPIPVETVLRELRGYFVRHLVVHNWRRALDRLPISRVELRSSATRNDSTRTNLQPRSLAGHEVQMFPTPATPEALLSGGMKHARAEEDEVDDRDRGRPSQEDEQPGSMDKRGPVRGHYGGGRVLDSRDQEIASQLGGDRQSERVSVSPYEPALEREVRNNGEQEAGDQRDLERHANDAHK